MLPSTRALSLLSLVLLPLAWIACSSTETQPPSSTSTTSTTSSTASGSSDATTSSGSTGGLGGAGTTGSAAGTGGSGGSGSTSSGSSGAGGAGGGAPDQHLRVVSANLTSGNLQSYDPGEGVRILQGIHPDVVLMQEINYGGDSIDDLRKLTDDICGPDCTLTRGTGQIPNGVISRYPVLEAGVWVDPQVDNRDFAWARIDIPGPIDLWAVSVHLLTSNASERDTEAKALVVKLQAAVPVSDYLVMGGDFNTHDRAEAALTTLTARFSVTGPYPIDNAGNENTNGPRTKPFDWILPSPELRAVEAPVLIGASSFAAGLVVDTRVYTPMSDLSPAQVADSDATSMQHMAVVRDFLVAGAPVTSGGI